MVRRSVEKPATYSEVAAEIEAEGGRKRKPQSQRQTATKEVISLAKALTEEPVFQKFKLWLIGTTPIITHAWSHKARLEMLQKQVKAPRAGKEARDPEQDFVDSLYPMGTDKDGNTTYGFPISGLKNCIISAAHKDKGIAKSVVMSALWLDAEMVRVRPALAGAICDMPLARIYGSTPAMREDMVRIGSGLTKIASLAYRGQFTTWAMRVTGQYNVTSLNAEQLVFLIQEAGMSYGLGEWRNERKGVFGSFRLADVAEEADWEAYFNGEGPLPRIEYAAAAE